jgi:hypothetical protein
MVAVRQQGKTYRRIGAVIGRGPMTVYAKLNPAAARENKHRGLARYYREHSECLASARLYYLEHKQECHARAAAWRLRHPERLREMKRLQRRRWRSRQRERRLNGNN